MMLLSGTRAWSVQRITAIYMLAYMVAVGVCLAIHGTPSFALWRHLMSSSIAAVPTFAFFTALLLHLWVGLRDVILDYVHPLVVRVLLLSVIVCGIVALEGWVLITLARA